MNKDDSNDNALLGCASALLVVVITVVVTLVTKIILHWLTGGN